MVHMHVRHVAVAAAMFATAQEQKAVHDWEKKGHLSRAEILGVAQRWSSSLGQIT